MGRGELVYGRMILFARAAFFPWRRTVSLTAGGLSRDSHAASRQETCLVDTGRLCYDAARKGGTIGLPQTGDRMTAESGLKWLLRFIALTTVPAFFAAVMPQPWLAYLIAKGAPGTSAGILVTYLARMLMVLYAFLGLQALVISMDIPRYLPLVWIIGVGSLVLASVGLVVLFTQVPPEQRTGSFWVVFVDFAEGLAQAVLMVILLLRIPRPHLPSEHSPSPTLTR
jgi:hypothetical protein